MLFLWANATSQIEYDKKAHFVAGAWISACTYHVAHGITNDKKKAFIISMMTGTLAGITKEIIDSQRPHNRFDTNDLATTILGSFTVSISFEIIIQ